MAHGVAQRAKMGILVCGDAYLLLEAGPRLVVALADGLGSGEKAAHSAQLAMQGVAEHAAAALNDILSYCHYTILAAGGVGVMMAILRLDTAGRSLEFSGVGNIRFQAHSRQNIQPFTRFGYLGVRLPSLQVFRFPYDAGDAFVLHSDGISTRFHLSHHTRDLEAGAQSLAERILEQYGKAHDDATVVVVET